MTFSKVSWSSRAPSSFVVRFAMVFPPLFFGLPPYFYRPPEKYTVCRPCERKKLTVLPPAAQSRRRAQGERVYGDQRESSGKSPLPPGAACAGAAGRRCVAALHPSTRSPGHAPGKNRPTPPPPGERPEALPFQAVDGQDAPQEQPPSLGHQSAQQAPARRSRQICLKKPFSVVRTPDLDHRPGSLFGNLPMHARTSK